MTRQCAARTEPRSAASVATCGAKNRTVLASHADQKWPSTAAREKPVSPRSLRTWTPTPSIDPQTHVLLRWQRWPRLAGLTRSRLLLHPRSKGRRVPPLWKKILDRQGSGGQHQARSPGSTPAPPRLRSDGRGSGTESSLQATLACFHGGRAVPPQLLPSTHPRT